MGRNLRVASWYKQWSMLFFWNKDFSPQKSVRVIMTCPDDYFIQKYPIIFSFQLQEIFTIALLSHYLVCSRWVHYPFCIYSHNTVHNGIISSLLSRQQGLIIKLDCWILERWGQLWWVHSFFNCWFYPKKVKFRWSFETCDGICHQYPSRLSDAS